MFMNSYTNVIAHQRYEELLQQAAQERLLQAAKNKSGLADRQMDRVALKFTLISRLLNTTR